jgi:hypothetical protein
VSSVGKIATPNFTSDPRADRGPIGSCSAAEPPDRSSSLVAEEHGGDNLEIRRNPQRLLARHEE